MSKNKNGWDRKLGTSKKEQGIFTPKRPYQEVCGCDFREGELFRGDWRCRIHMAVKLVTPEPDAQPKAPKTPPVEQPIEQAPAQPVQPYHGFVDQTKTSDDVAVSLG